MEYFMLHNRIIIFVVPSMPRNVTAMSINSTSILILWEPPEFLNGVLLFYVVNYTSEELGGMPTTNSINTMDDTSVIISNLTPFTVYNVSVVGVTVEEGPPSDVVMIMTNESGRYTCTTAVMVPFFRWGKNFANFSPSCFYFNHISCVHMLMITQAPLPS